MAALAVGTPVVVGAGLLAGTAGAVSAAVGVGCVLVLFGVSAAALAWAAPRGRRAVGRAVAYGAGLRLIGYAAALTLLAADDAVLHEGSLAVGIIATFIGTLAVEMRTLVRSPEALWIDVAPESRSVPDRTDGAGADRRSRAVTGATDL